MDSTPIVVERTYNAPADKIWKAITDRDQMKQWYFDLEEFRPEPGFQFSFIAEGNGVKYIHLCEIKEVIEGKKLSHSWRYEGYPGDSLVTWELFPEGETTRVVLTHTGLETFQGDKYPELKKDNFLNGWTDILGTALKNYLEK